MIWHLVNLSDAFFKLFLDLLIKNSNDGTKKLVLNYRGGMVFVECLKDFFYCSELLFIQYFY